MTKARISNYYLFIGLILRLEGQKITKISTHQKKIHVGTYLPVLQAKTNTSKRSNWFIFLVIKSLYSDRLR